MKKILIINGPNLNLLGNREDDIYGKDSLDKIKSDCEKKGIEKKLEIIFFYEKFFIITFDRFPIIIYFMRFNI